MYQHGLLTHLFDEIKSKLVNLLLPGAKKDNTLFTKGVYYQSR